MNLYLVRHGVTAWNLAGRYQGWVHTDLTPAGIAQARQTAAFFAGYRAAQDLTFAGLYSSPSRRTWHTAAILGDWLGLVPVAAPDLREMHGGDVEGLTQAEWQSRYPELVPAWRDPANLDFRWPGGETRRAFRARCQAAIAAIQARHRLADHVLVVTHGGLIAAYLEDAAGAGPAGTAAVDVANCSVTHVQFSSAPGAAPDAAPTVACLRAVNQVAHLADLRAPSTLR